MMHLILLSSILLAAISGLLPIVCLKRWPFLCGLVSFILVGLSGVGLLMTGLLTFLGHASWVIQLPIGIPFIVWSMRLDVLSGFFLCLIGLVTIAISFYGPGYLRNYENTKQSFYALILFTGLFLASMSLVVLSNDLFSFMFSWELMSLTSYFLVIYQHQYAENRKAAQIYLLMAHVSGLLILIAFGILAMLSGGYNFQAMHAAHLTPFLASLVFLFAFLGFGMKAGLVPLHVWLPKAHPVAPSHISALMSGVMLKVAVYGFIRVVFTLLGGLHWQWGVLVLFVGSLSVLWGILYALVQNDLKRLLAYSSVENIGIIFVGLGLSMIFISDGHPVLGALGLIASLYHCLNHAVFKSLLFLGAGAVLQHTHEHDLDRMGGLIHKMPQTAFFFLIGCLSISALPPFNGFVSEWLIFQTSLQVSVLHSGIMRVMIPLSAAILALTGALAAACFSKIYGVAFLGQPRTRHVRHARKPSLGMRISMASLATFCLLFGVLPSLTLPFINQIPKALFNASLPTLTLKHWLWLAPISSQVASYSASLVLIGVMLIAVVTYWVLKGRSYAVSFKQRPAWDCGFGGLSARMQYTSTAFAMPIRRVFKGAWKVDETVEIQEKTDQQAKSKYVLHLRDWIWVKAYQPLDRWMIKVARGLARLQGGNIRVYLAYTFFTLILLLWVIA